MVWRNWYNISMEKIMVSSTKKNQVIDITLRINKLLKANKKTFGLCNVFVTHTTAALTVADLDPGTDLDLLEALSAMVPKLSYRHPHDPSHVGDHILSSLVGSSLTLPFKDNRLLLGSWQSVVLVEFNGPRDRTIIVSTVS